MSDVIRYPCPACGKRLKALREHLGRGARCACGESHRIPEVATGTDDPADGPGPEAIPRLVAILVQWDSGDVPRAVAARELCAAASTPLAIVAAARAIQEELKEADWDRIKRTVGVLADNGLAAAPLLLECLNDPPPGLTLDIISALAQMGRPVIPELIRALGEVALRESVLSTLWRVGGDAGDAVSAVLALLTDSDRSIRSSACRTLGAIGGASQEAVRGLTDVYEIDDDEDVRAAAANALGDIGPAAIAATAALVRGLRGQDRYHRSRAQAALEAIHPGGRSPIPFLLRWKNRLRDGYADFDLRETWGKVTRVLRSPVKAWSGAGGCGKCGREISVRDLTAFSCGQCDKMYCGSCTVIKQGMVTRLSCPTCG